MGGGQLPPLYPSLVQASRPFITSTPLDRRFLYILQAQGEGLVGRRGYKLNDQCKPSEADWSSDEQQASLWVSRKELVSSEAKSGRGQAAHQLHGISPKEGLP